MKKQILVWNPEIKLYSTRYANTEEIVLFKRLKNLRIELKQIMDRIDSYEGEMHLGLYNTECKIREEMLNISATLGISLNIPGHIWW